VGGDLGLRAVQTRGRSQTLSTGLAERKRALIPSSAHVSGFSRLAFRCSDPINTGRRGRCPAGCCTHRQRPRTLRGIGRNEVDCSVYGAGASNSSRRCRRRAPHYFDPGGAVSRFQTDRLHPPLIIIRSPLRSSRLRHPLRRGHQRHLWRIAHQQSAIRSICLYSAGAAAPAPTRRGMCSPTAAIKALTPVNAAKP
jgi:hypothetical protein